MNLRRNFVTEVRAAKDGIVELSFSSDAPVMMGSVREILDHDEKSVDLVRMNSGAPVLFEHNLERVIGVVEKAWIEKGKGRARIRFGTTALAVDIARDVAAGIRRNISVGYRVVKHALIAGVRRVTQWEPYEISVVSVPADVTVGFGRSRSNSNQPNKMITQKVMKETRGAKLKALHEFRYAGDVPTQEETDQVATLESEISRLDSAIATEDRKLNADFARGRRQSGGNDSDFGFPSITSGGHEYSLTRAIALQAKGRLDGLELEVHQELSRTMPEAPRGVVVPWSAATRDMTATGQTTVPGDQGGSTIPTEIAQLLDPRFNAQVLRKLGATFFTGLQGNLDLPRGTAATVGWKAENGAVDETSPEVSSLQLRPHRIGAYIDVSNQLLIQNTVSIDNWLRRNLSSAIEEEWQAAAIKGSGTSNQPLGILNTNGLGAVAMGTNGLAPTWAKLVELEGTPALVDADVGALGFLVNTKTRSKLKTVLRNPAGTDGTFIWSDDNRLLGYNTGVTNSVPSNLTKGTSNGVCSAIIFGNFRDLVMAQWGQGIDVLVDPYSASKTGMTVLVASAYLDSGVRRADSFGSIKDILTT